MTWEPESFTSDQRRAAAKAVVRAQGLLDHLDRKEFGLNNAEMVTRIYARVDDMLAMLYDDLYGSDSITAQWPRTS